MPNDYLPALCAELRRAGVATWTLDTGKHHKLRFWHRGQRRLFVFPQSPSDTRGVRNAVGDLRKLLGLTGARAKSPHPPKRRTQRAEKAPALQAEPRRDPWEKLREWG